MNGVFLVLLAAVAGWLTGKLIGEQSYGKTLVGSASSGLDMIFGAAGAAVGQYLFFWAVIGEGSTFSRTGTAVLGAVSLVVIARLVSARSFRLVYMFRHRGEGLKARST